MTFYYKRRYIMSNMFTGKQNKKVPQSIADCIAPDSLSLNLWRWCQRVETFGWIMATVVIILGFIQSIQAASAVQELETLYGRDKQSFDVWVFLLGLLETAIKAFITYCSFHSVALLLGAISSIVQNTRISADLALLNSMSKPELPVKKCEDEEKSVAAKTWVCKNCKAVNSSNSIFCASCGENKEEKKTPMTWACSKCGAVNSASHIFCQSCGENR